ncbi:flippase-like domain-containing protein [Candidatus Saccharibacteria bacterium]|nr:flippase-like domain-containing protein [Candidatus Saccharibacteria bacterium]
MSEKTKKKKWIKPLLIFLFILLNVVVIGATAVAEFGNSKDATEFSEISINWWLLVPATLCFLVALTIDIHKYVLMIRKMSRDNQEQGNIRKVARRTVLLGKYYDNITPAAVGGQPFQMYYMRKNSGLSRGASTSIPIFGMISIQIAFIIIAVICFVFGGLVHSNPALLLTALFGLLFYAFWPVMVAGVTYFPKPTTKLLKSIIKLLAKIKIIKNKEKVLQKIENEADEYVGAVKMILKTKGLFLTVIVWSLIYNILIASIPYFVLSAFGGSVDFLSCFVITIAVMAAIYFVPTPGNSGAAEGTFFVVFSALSSGYVFWAMLIWRFFSYYVYIIIGPIIYFFMHLEKRKKS